MRSISTTNLGNGIWRTCVPGFANIHGPPYEHTRACDYAHMVCRNGKGTTMMCPYCGEEIQTWRQQMKEINELTDKLAETMRKFTKEMRDARRQMAMQQENPPIGMRVNQHWGQHRKRRPAWQKDKAFTKQTKRPSRYRR